MATSVFDIPLSVQRQQRQQQRTIAEPVPVVRESVSVQVHQRKDFIATDSSSWTWSQLRDYVITAIEAKEGGPVPRIEEYKERSIFQGFLARHKELAGPIAQHAFEVCDGMWKGSPIGVRRFCSGSDEYFADVIKARLRDRM